jgi:hypothetical protein
LKKATKLSFQPAQYKKKPTKTIFKKKKKSILGKRNEKKNKSEKKTRGKSYSV